VHCQEGGGLVSELAAGVECEGEGTVDRGGGNDAFAFVKDMLVDLIAEFGGEAEEW